MSFFYFIKQAIQEEKKENFTKAFNLYQKAFEFSLSPKTQIKVAARKAWCQEHVGNHNMALEIFTKLPIEYPDHPESILESSIYYIKLNSLKQAKLLLKSGIDKFPYYLEFYLTLSYILRETNRANESIEILKKALVQPKLTNGRGGITRKDIWAELGNLYFLRGNYNSCIVSLKKSLRMENDQKEFLYFDLIAKSYLKINDPYNALKFIDAHLDIFEDRDPDDYILKARAHCRLSELHLAASCILQAYNKEGYLNLKTEDMIDFSPLVQKGFFESLENVIIDEEL
jgi:tetratricopeptide (TPR) repeat protein